MRARYDDGGPPDPPEDPIVGIMEELEAEVSRQRSMGNADIDVSNLPNDWIALVVAYLGRASRKVFRNDREECGYRENLVKAGALIISAIRTNDLGYPLSPSDDKGEAF